MNKKLIVLIIAFAFVGGIFGPLIFINRVNANFLQDLYNNFKNSFSQETIIPGNSVVEGEKGIYESDINYENAVIGAVEKASPGVVSIIISKDVPVIEKCPYSPFLNLPQEFKDFFGGGMEFYQECQEGTELQEVGGGSGFIISTDGLIITNKHVVSDTKASYTVLTNDGEKYEAKVLAQSPVLDLAVMKIEANNLPILVLGDSGGIRLGQTAIAIGNALGEFRNTISIGVVSGLARTITASGRDFGTETIEGVIQTSAAINQGNSGGPLLNLKGEVIGINVAMVSGAQNVGFAIPINQAKQAISSVQKTGRIATSYVGVRYVTISSDLAKEEKLSVDYGVLVRSDNKSPAIIKGSPADKAGLKEGDIILEINGKKIDINNSLISSVQNYSVGDNVVLKVLRGGKEIEVNVLLEERPNL